MSFGLRLSEATKHEQTAVISLTKSQTVECLDTKRLRTLKTTRSDLKVMRFLDEYKKSPG